MKYFIRKLTSKLQIENCCSIALLSPLSTVGSVYPGGVRVCGAGFNILQEDNAFQSFIA